MSDVEKVLDQLEKAPAWGIVVPGRRVICVAKLVPDAKLPTRGSAGAAGWDLYAVEPTWIRAGQVRVVRTGLALELPDGYEAQVRPRSGLTSEGVIVVLGTIDSDYRGEIGVSMYVLSDSREIRRGDRIAQLVIAQLAPVTLGETERSALTPSERGERGFGSTGR